MLKYICNRIINGVNMKKTLMPVCLILRGKLGNLLIKARKLQI